MKVVIVSDNHGKIECLKQIINKHQDADAFIHCGDSELPSEYLDKFVVVKGNNDYFTNYPELKIIEFGKHRILLTHGHQYFFQTLQQQLAEKAIRHGCDIVCYGHTHVFNHAVIEGITLINPGSLFRNRDGSKIGYALMVINEDQIEVQRIDY